MRRFPAPQARRRVVTLACGAAILGSSAFAMAGCGGDDTAGSAGVAQADAVASTSTTSTATSGGADGGNEALLDFSKCMRDNGVADFPDPVADADGTLQFDPTGLRSIDQTELQQGLEACEGLLPNGGQLGGRDQTEFEDNVLAFTRCLREEGIDVEDPQFDSNSVGPPDSLTRLDQNDPKVQAATEVCQDELGDAIPGGG